MTKTYRSLFYLPHPPMQAMQQWALEHGFYWPGCTGIAEDDTDEE